MPSPFPGMNPYLEGAEWISVHVALSAEIARQLAAQIRPKYIVRPACGFITAMPEDIVLTTGDIAPDVSVADTPGMAERETSAAAVASLPLHLATVMPQRLPQVTVEIRDVTQRAASHGH